MTLRDILGPICAILDSERIRYAIIGGYAVAVWGRIRATRDVDILCDVSDLNRLKGALSKSGFQWEYRRGDPDDPVGHVIRIRIPSNEGIDEIEILAGIANAPNDIFSRIRPARIGDLQLQIASPEDMIVLKLLAGSPLDCQDALGILRSNLQQMDIALVKRLCPERVRESLVTLLRESDPSIQT